jgi:hypothetical protein
MFRTVVHSALAIIIFFVGGCYPPQPPVSVNARLPKDAHTYFYFWEPWSKEDVCLLARCKEIIKDYAITVRGNWERHWCVISSEIIEVTRGKWPDDHLTFIYYYTWPTPESGIVVKAGEFPYSEGNVFRFWLDTTVKPALIVMEEECSSDPPYKRIKTSWKVHDRVIASVKTFLNRERGPCITRRIRIVEERDDEFVVEYIEGIEDKLSDKMLVDKDTFEVRWISPP